MVIPVGKSVSLSITSRDVIHSFWIPRAQRQARRRPRSRRSPSHIEADNPGDYYGQCTEFCGLAHANMRMRVVALSQSDFDAWVANQLQAGDRPDRRPRQGRARPSSRPSARGCHTVNGLTDDQGQQIVSQANQQLVSGAAPNLTHLMSRTVFAGATYNLAAAGVHGRSPGRCPPAPPRRVST